MIKFFKSLFIRCAVPLAAVFIFACTGVSGTSGADSTDTIDSGTTEADGGVGTTVNKPGIPSLSLFPDFSSAFPDVTLGGDSDASNLVRAAVMPVPRTDSDNAPGLTVGQLWTGTITEGSVREGVVLRSEIEVFGELTARSISLQGLSEADETLQSVTIATESGEAHLVDTDTAWIVRFIQDSSDAEYVRFYFVNGATGFIEGTYVVKTDDEGNAVRGIFAYVNPTHLNDTPTTGKSLVAFAFDVTDSARNLFALRETFYNDSRAVDITYHLHQQCDTGTKDCVGEYVELWNADERSLNEANNIRVAWNDDTNAVCLAEIHYGGALTTTDVTHSFTGPDTPADEDIVDDVCTVATPNWGEHIVTESDLPQRYEDTDPVGGTALQYYVDGLATSGWDQITPDMIDGWLDGSGF